MRIRRRQARRAGPDDEYVERPGILEAGRDVVAVLREVLARRVDEGGVVG